MTCSAVLDSLGEQRIQSKEEVWKLMIALMLCGCKAMVVLFPVITAVFPVVGFNRKRALHAFSASSSFTLLPCLSLLLLAWKEILGDELS